MMRTRCGVHANPCNRNVVEFCTGPSRGMLVASRHGSSLAACCAGFYSDEHPRAPDWRKHHAVDLGCWIRFAGSRSAGMVSARSGRLHYQPIAPWACFNKGSSPSRPRWSCLVHQRGGGSRDVELDVICTGGAGALLLKRGRAVLRGDDRPPPPATIAGGLPQRPWAG
jgi:hypothetical protein